MEEAGERTLRAKYLDWCSARVAERFLDLSAEAIWSLAHPDRAEASEPPTGLPAATDESYRTLVQRATEALLSQMSLPGFDEWRREYEESPARFDREMLGFWRETSGGDPGG
jgi:hypothetical protein